MSFSPSETAAILPLAIPAAAACLLPIASLDRDQETVKWVRGAFFGIALLAILGSFFYVTQLWGTGQQPVWTQLRFDRLAQAAAILVLAAAAFAVLQLWDHLHHEGWVKAEILALLLCSVTGMLLFASTTHLLVLFLGLELLSLPLYALTATVRFRAGALEGAMKYFLTGAVASGCFLMGLVLVYGTTGSLELRSASVAAAASDPLFLAGAALMLGGFLFKVSAVPFHQWTPDAYEAAPHPVSGFMSVATKTVALVALLRVFPGALALSGPLAPKAQAAVALFAALTIVLGNLTALSQTKVKRMLAYSSVSHAGYLLLAFVAGTAQAYAGMLVYLAAYLAMNMGAFGLLSALSLPGDRGDLEDLRGLGWKRPELGVAMGLCLLSLAGIPPTAGFFGKYMVFKELVQQGHVGLTVLAVLGSLVSVAYYLRVLAALFGEPSPERLREDAERPQASAPLAGATVLAAAILVVMGGLWQGLLSEGFALRAIQDALPFLH